MQNTGNTALKRMIFSDLLLTKSQGHRLAYMAVMAALCVVANMWLEFRLLDIQFSVTIVVSALTGILLGPVSGFAVCYIGDLCGYFYNSWGQLYMPWVGLSTGMIALLAGLVFNLFRPNFRGSLYVKLSLVCLLSLFVCTIGINTTGFYFYFQKVGFSPKFIQYISDTFGTGATYWGYVCYRLFFGGQIWNCIANYALLFAVVPILNHIKPLKIRIS